MAKSFHSVGDEGFLPAKSFHPVEDKGFLLEKNPFHRPVMTAEVVDFFKPLHGGIFLDATVGGGGHSIIIMNELKPKRLIGIDQDPEAVAVAARQLAGLGQSGAGLKQSVLGLKQSGTELKQPAVEIFLEKFSNLKSVLAKLGIEKISGILFDLGVSLHQLTTPGRGFSYTLDGPLDMRMSAGRSGPSGKTCPASMPGFAGLTAHEVIKNSTERQLVEIFSKYGEEHYSKRIARAIVQCRNRIETTADLAAVIKKAVPPGQSVKSLARVFQALRIYVNKELAELEQGLQAGVGTLAPRGRIVVLAYHSLEDRIVKITFKEFAKNGGLKILTKKPLRPSPAETSSNPQARSARLRAAEKVA
jgi:16S rRNA (cytosine1402-N4)-methyltransferase